MAAQSNHSWNSFTLAEGRRYPQRFIELDDDAWPSPSTCVWPTAKQSDALVQMLQDRSLEDSLLASLQRPLPVGVQQHDPRAAERALELAIAQLTAELDAEAACTAQLRAELEEWQLGSSTGRAGSLEKLSKPESPSKSSRRHSRSAAVDSTPQSPQRRLSTGTAS